MRDLSLGVLLTLGAALAAPAHAQQITIPARPHSLSGEPLAAPDARLFGPDRGQLRFALGESLYVALFEMQPGRGVRLVYPTDDATPERPLDAGWQIVPMPANDVLANEPGSRLGDGPLAVRYLYLVAARHPLGLAPGRRSPAAISAATGLGAFRSSDVTQQWSGVYMRLLALREPNAWTVASLSTTKAGLAASSGSPDQARVICPNGQSYSVAPNASFTCPR